MKKAGSACQQNAKFKWCKHLKWKESGGEWQWFVAHDNDKTGCKAFYGDSGYNGLSEEPDECWKFCPICGVKRPRCKGCGKDV